MSTWKPEAEKMLAEGHTYREIGAALGRSPARVHRVLNPKRYVRETRAPYTDTEENKRRRLVRRWCRRNAPRLGVAVEALYEKHGVGDLDRTAIWEGRAIK